LSSDCPFCKAPSHALVGENDLAFALRDKFPVRPLHTLIIPKRHAPDIFETTNEEREALHGLALACRAAISREDPSVEGFNFGSNVGAAAGQKIFHAHLHLIPRRIGDTPPPPGRAEDKKPTA
jgi:diadenosine tetraphosphate (Ap4A) HIT family hydrolase